MIALRFARWPLVAFGAALAYVAGPRRGMLHWGASGDEVGSSFPGDELVSQPHYVSTRAITITAPPAAVWPWLVQLGQGRGGFYTYDRLEQLIGANISSVDQIVPEFQALAIGDIVRLSPVGGPAVAHLEPLHALVLHDVMNVASGRSVPRGGRARFSLDWSWSFVLRAEGAGTRLIIRTRARLAPRSLLQPLAFLLLEPIHFAMERGTLLGIKRRAEGAARPAARSGAPGRNGAAQVGQKIVV